jgi:hypothetical protein
MAVVAGSRVIKIALALYVRQDSAGRGCVKPHLVRQVSVYYLLRAWRLVRCLGKLLFLAQNSLRLDGHIVICLGPACSGFLCLGAVHRPA